MIGRAKVTVPAGRTRVLTIKLNRRGARLLAKAKRLKVTITISARIGRGASITSRRAATLRAPAKLRRR